MSEEKAGIVRRSTHAFTRGDLDGLVHDYAPDAVLDWSRSRGVGVGVYEGHSEIREFANRFLATWDQVRIEISDPVEIADDLLLTENVAYLRGRDGIEVQARSALLTKFRDGNQIAAVTLYQTREDALEAAGQSE